MDTSTAHDHHRHQHGPATVEDPVCHMEVVPGAAKGGSAEHQGTTYWFCSAHCRTKFVASPASYVEAKAAPSPSSDEDERIYTCPMHPEIRQKGPGSCPICGMDLVPTSEYGYTDAPVPQPEVLVVPRRAVLMTGSTSLVYVETVPGRFEIRPVTLGPLLRDEAVIVDGVTAGEQVAVNGNFLIDSQMQLAGKPSLIDPTRVVAAKKDDKERDKPQRPTRCVPRR